MRRKITLAFLILAAFLLQTTVFQYFQIASVTPNLLLILTSAFGLMRGKKEGLMVGFFSGLMIDLFYGSLFVDRTLFRHIFRAFNLYKFRSDDCPRIRSDGIKSF